MIEKEIIYFGEKQILYCDNKCHKAWGINNRPRIQLTKEIDDYAFLSDNELGLAPLYPDSYEGSDTKPLVVEDKLNKWCCRECERSKLCSLNETRHLLDFNKRQFNIKRDSV